MPWPTQEENLEGVRLNGRTIAASAVRVNPVLDRDATKAYLGFRKDGLDSIGVEVKGRHMVVVGRGFPANIDAGDRLELSGETARVLYQEQEVNDFGEGFAGALRGPVGGAYLLGGALAGAGAAYTFSLVGWITFPIVPALLVCAAVGAFLALGLLGTFKGLGARLRPVDLSVTNRLAEPSFPGSKAQHEILGYPELRTLQEK